MKRIEIKMKIKSWEGSFIRDRWDNLTNCYWNQMAKEEIKGFEKLLNEPHD